MDALKPCPFCGGAARFDQIEMQVQCTTQNCTGQSWMFDTLAEAIAAWNHRPETERLVEALESATVALEEASKVLIGKGLPAFADVVFGHAERNNALLSSRKGTEG